MPNPPYEHAASDRKRKDGFASKKIIKQFFVSFIT